MTHVLGGVDADGSYRGVHSLMGAQSALGLFDQEVAVVKEHLHQPKFSLAFMSENQEEWALAYILAKLLDGRKALTAAGAFSTAKGFIADAHPPISAESIQSTFNRWLGN